MERLTFYDDNGRVVSRRGYELALSKLASYEDVGPTPEQLLEIDKMYFEKCQEVANLKNSWIPVSERLPKETVNPITRDAYVYPVSVDLGGVTDIRYYSFCRGHWYNQGPKEMDDLVIAWKERPEPYKTDWLLGLE